MSRNIQEYVANRVISYLEEKNAKLEHFDRIYSIEKCHHCKNNIYFKKKSCSFKKLYKVKKYRRCSNEDCTFIICGVCQGDFIDWYNPKPDDNYNYKSVYMWTGNPWLGVHPRPIEDEDYVCCPDCPIKNIK